MEDPRTVRLGWGRGAASATQEPGISGGVFTEKLSHNTSTGKQKVDNTARMRTGQDAGGCWRSTVR